MFWEVRDVLNRFLLPHSIHFFLLLLLLPGLFIFELRRRTDDSRDKRQNIIEMIDLRVKLFLRACRLQQKTKTMRRTGRFPSTANPIQKCQGQRSWRQEEQVANAMHLPLKSVLLGAILSRSNWYVSHTIAIATIDSDIERLEQERSGLAAEDLS